MPASTPPQPDARDAPAGRWSLWIDTGGTFTDCIGVDPGGRVVRAKVLSTSAVRIRAQRWESPTTLVCADAAAAQPAALIGMRVGLAGGGSRDPAAPTIVEADDSGRVLKLSGPLPASAVVAGALAEVWADEEAPILAARLVTGTAAGAALPPISMRVGTTRGTNALLERRGCGVAFFVTEGFGDLLEIGTQQRPDLFALNIVKQAQLYEEVIEVPGRLDAGGREIRPLNLEAIEGPARAALERGVRHAAVALLHAWANPAHENALAERLRGLGFESVSVSSSLSPSIGVLGRAQTAVVNAYLIPAVGSYVERIRERLDGGREVRGSRLHFMTSSGGLVGPDDFRPKDSLLSGPAGGVVGAAAAARAVGCARIIAFDMGGTSTDVSRWDGGFDYSFEHQVGAARILAPALAIQSVAAGGGSVCWVEDGELRVGPRSAGASPGPACYGAGGPLTISDCNLLLGRLDPAGFQIPVDAAPARARLIELMKELEEQGSRAEDPVGSDLGRELGPDPDDPDAVLEGFLEIANERMAAAAAQVSTRRGYDPREHAIVAFGGAGGQHACGVARRLGISRIIVPADAGLLSALGIGRAAVERFAGRQVLRELEAYWPELESTLESLAAEATRAIACESDSGGAIRVRRRILQLRLRGQESTIGVEVPAGSTLPAIARDFRDKYASLYGHAPPDRPVEIESVRVVAAAEADGAWGSFAVDAQRPSFRGVSSVRRARFDGRWLDVPVLMRGELVAGASLTGPALVLDSSSTTVIEAGWSGRIHESGAIVLERDESGAPPRIGLHLAAQHAIDTGRLAAIAEEMGEMLRRTALSTNVKERLDFSCAVLGPDGRLAVNAPHIPVHLGALGECVRRVCERLPLGPGDVAVTNHPAFGGSHLPDITVITPVFGEDGAGPLVYVACRAHHAEIGGTKPGSMPTDASTLAEEGVVIPPMYLVQCGDDRWRDIERLFREAPFPSRAPEENLADLRAQVAANQLGVRSLLAFAKERGAAALHEAMNRLTARAAGAVTAAMQSLASRGAAFEAIEHLDDGSPLAVRIEPAASGATFDFTGSSAAHPGNLNATPAIVRSAVMYVLRLLLDEPLPLNEGMLAPIRLVIPHGILNPGFDAAPESCPAVAGGNTETSQRLVDTLLKALGLCACGQGTMNNLLFGNDRFGYYETIGGGAGAGPGFHGAAAVHTHMTNTRITDPEILEHRYPVRLERFAIRRGSGGEGRFRGGDGAEREFVFLSQCSLSLLTQHRVEGPYGAAGGRPGRPGAQWLHRASGAVEQLASIDGRDVYSGDRLVVHTPGGGGYGMVEGGR